MKAPKREGKPARKVTQKVAQRPSRTKAGKVKKCTAAIRKQPNGKQSKSPPQKQSNKKKSQHNSKNIPIGGTSRAAKQPVILGFVTVPKKETKKEKAVKKKARVEKKVQTASTDQTQLNLPFAQNFDIEVDMGPPTASAKLERETGFLLPPLNSKARRPGQIREYTLVLDLDETLVHCDKLFFNYKVRPHANRFLAEMKKHYEVVVFTAGMPDYADWVLNELDITKNLIQYRLYRDSCTHMNGIFIKDLTRLGRDLSKTIIVDNIAANFYLQPDNGIQIRSWYDDAKDFALKELEPILKRVVNEKVPDVREFLSDLFEEQMEQFFKKKHSKDEFQEF